MGEFFSPRLWSGDSLSRHMLESDVDLYIAKELQYGSFESSDDKIQYRPHWKR